MRIQLKQALISYQHYHMFLHTLAGILLKMVTGAFTSFSFLTWARPAQTPLAPCDNPGTKVHMCGIDVAGTSKW